MVRKKAGKSFVGIFMNKFLMPLLQNFKPYDDFPMYDFVQISRNKASET